MKSIIWIGSSKKDLIALPEDIRAEFGFALFQAQNGQIPDRAKVLKGFGNANLQEIITNNRAGTYRAVYTVQFANKIYVLHVFQKKAKSGIATPKPDIELIEKRLKQVLEMECQNG